MKFRLAKPAKPSPGWIKPARDGWMKRGTHMAAGMDEKRGAMEGKACQAKPT